MPKRQLAIRGDVPPALADGLNRLAEQLQLPGAFPPDAEAEASALAHTGPAPSPARPALDLPFVTIDPPGSKDLDQALFIESAGSGFRVWYALTDLAAWVSPGGAIDAAARARGQTCYAPNMRLLLHPAVLCEDAASLLPDGKPRPANVWRIDLDAAGAVTNFTVTRANVTSTARLDYAGVQKDIDAGTASEALRLLKTVGELRVQQEALRGGISLKLPEQEVVSADGTWRLDYREVLPVENWNAQISLLTGFCAASLMRSHQVGILRTLPPPDDHTIELLRRIAASLGLRWPDAVTYPAFVRALDPTSPKDQAMMNAGTMLFRGAGYTVIGGPEDTGNMPHGALASEYAHVTAPLRRLVDRFTGEICATLAAGEPVPGWVTDALPTLPPTMAASDHRVRAFERGVVDFTEALVMQHDVGALFSGVVIEVDPRDRRAGRASLPDQAVEGPVRADTPLTLGSQVSLRLVTADTSTGRIEFAEAG